MWTISIAALSLLLAICALGLWHNSFRDNFIQCVGMAGLCVVLVGRIARIWTGEYVDYGEASIHICVAIYAIGTAQKVAIWHGREAGWPWLVNLDRWMFNKQTAAGAFDDKPHHHSGGL